MNKPFKVVIFLLFALILAGCGNNLDQFTSKIAGTWRFNRLTVATYLNGIEQSSENIELEDGIIIFQNDNTASLDQGQSYPLSWTYNEENRILKIENKAGIVDIWEVIRFRKKEQSWIKIHEENTPDGLLTVHSSLTLIK